MFSCKKDPILVLTVSVIVKISIFLLFSTPLSKERGLFLSISVNDTSIFYMQLH